MTNEAPPIESQALPPPGVGPEATVNRDALPVQAVKALGGEAVALYFHGSNYPFRAGEQVAPGAGAINDRDGNLYASATTQEQTAWAYAQSKETLEGGRARVFRVVPTDGQTVKQLGPQRGEVNSPHFTVVDEINIKPDQQGTFPEVNWSNYSPYIEANHPQDPLYTPESDWQEYDGPTPDDVPIPELDQTYVDAELERQRLAAGRPKM